MNEQIEKLFNQALKEFKAENEHATIVVPDPVQRHFVEQFAELIVAECATSIANDTANYQGEGMMAYYQGVQDAVKVIRKHFGVEP